MAGLRQAIEARLSAAPGLVALVGDRIYPTMLPQKPTYPAVRFQRIDGQWNSAMGVDSSQASALVQVDAFSDVGDKADAVATQVRLALKRWRGTSAGVVISDVFLASGPNDIYEETVRIYRVQQDFTVWYRE